MSEWVKGSRCNDIGFCNHICIKYWMRVQNKSTSRLMLFICNPRIVFLGGENFAHYFVYAGAEMGEENGKMTPVKRFMWYILVIKVCIFATKILYPLRIWWLYAISNFLQSPSRIFILHLPYLVYVDALYQAILNDILFLIPFECVQIWRCWSNLKSFKYAIW